MALGACRCVDDYEKVGRIGQGTYGLVYLARERGTGALRALKRVIMHNEKQDGFPITSLREIGALRRLSRDHENVVTLLDVCAGPQRDQVFLVFEYLEHDLAALLARMAPRAFSPGEAKRLGLQLLRGVKFLHDNWIVHRDLKMSNLLYSRGVLKLCDFGLARPFGRPVGLRPSTPRVVTLWYRAPELLLGARHYSSAVDMWSCGCILGELLNGGRVLLPGDVEAGQFKLICALLGRPTEDIWPGMSALPGARAMLAGVADGTGPDKLRFNNLRREFSKLSDGGIALLDGLLKYDPNVRLTAGDALAHAFLVREAPPPTALRAMPSFPAPAIGQQSRK